MTLSEIHLKKMSNSKFNLLEIWNEIRQKIPLGRTSSFLQKVLVVKGKLCISLIIRPSDGLPGLLILVPDGLLKSEWKKNEYYGIIFESPQKVDNSFALPIILQDDKAEKIFESLANDLISSFQLNDDEIKIFKCLKEKISLWKRFFQKRKAKLDEDEIKGLIGEIYVLNQIAKKNGNDYALNSWKGPIPETFDFQLAKYRIEVKTWSNSSQPQIFISDPNQTIFDELNPIYLSALQISKDAVNGETLGAIVERMISTFNICQRDIFLSLLSDAGYLTAHKDSYPEKFSIVKQDFYFIGKSFPRIELLNVSPCITSIKYCIQLTGLSDFLVKSPI